MALPDPPACTVTETDRVAALLALGIMDTPAEQDFDNLTRLAARALGMASAAVSLLDDRRQWFKSRQGIPFSETPRDIAFCEYPLEQRRLFIVPDASRDPRFSDNPLVTCDGGIRFYAGVPLIIGSGHCLGTLCVFDPSPRPGLTREQEAVLRDLARLTVGLIETRRSRRLAEIAAKAVEATSDAVLATDRNGRIVCWNPAAERMFRRPQEQALDEPVEIIFPDRLATAQREVFLRATLGIAPAMTDAVELVGARADGSEFPLELSLAQWGDSGTDRGCAAVVREITDRKALERDREQAKAFLERVFANIPTMVFVKDSTSMRYVMLNHAGEFITGRRASEVIGLTDRQLFPGHADGSERRDRDAVASPVPSASEIAFVRDDGRTVHLRTTRTLIDGPSRHDQYILGVCEDVTKIRAAEAAVLRLAQFDALTGLLNRACYADRLDTLMRDGVPFAMLSIDLDRFKAVNDQFGHLAGDEVLALVGERLRSVVSSAGWVARIGGDEFAAILLGDRLLERAHEIADEIIAEVSEPIAMTHAVAHVGASVGVVVMPEDGPTIAQLRENADFALYRAKRNGKGCACFFNPDMDTAARDRRKLEADFRQAVEDDEITLAYQPVVAARSGRITSAEALARWTHPTRGPIRPDIFISIAEECGLIDELGKHLLCRACTDAQRWPEELRVAVNLSPLQFISGTLLETVRAALVLSGLAPQRLQLEVTEGLVIKDVERTFQQLGELRSLGIQVLIDDFGVGYSSLSYFQRFPFDKVKIDRSFIAGISTSLPAKAIVQAVVGLGERLGMGVVAEGVETEEQRRILVDCGCTHLQGYLFGRAMADAAFRELLAVGLYERRIEEACAA